ncbi:unnamed protein product [Linum trigynum]|uniref:Uncharacterized protein n=1 Tax=Linum trigynum TaxID=586398 RepID=A0AAV2D4I8_9ROSI
MEGGSPMFKEKAFGEKRMEQDDVVREVGGDLGEVERDPGDGEGNIVAVGVVDIGATKNKVDVVEIGMRLHKSIGGREFVSLQLIGSLTIVFYFLGS